MPSTTLQAAPPGGRPERTEHPTLADALAAAVATRRRTPDAVLRFELAEGVHRLPESLLVRAELSGVAGSPTVLTSAAGARAVISGSVVHPAPWRPFRDGLWVSELDGDVGVDQLWLDDERQVRARYPDHEPGRSPFGGTAADALAPERVRRWSHPEEAEVHALHAFRWGSVFARVTGVGADGAAELGPFTANNRVTAPDPDALHAELRYVENVFEELDAPGEWFHDRREGLLYLYPPDGLDPNEHRVELTGLVDLVRLVGAAGAPLHDVLVERLAFTHSARTVLRAEERLLRSDWALSRTGALLLEHTVEVAVRDCDFTDLGGNGVMISGDNAAAEVSGCLFADLGGSAVHLAGRVEAVRSPVVGYHAALEVDAIDRTTGPRTTDHPRDCRVHDNLITRIGTADLQAAGVGIDIAARVTVSHNSIYQVPRAGINVGTGNFGGHLIEHNDVFETVLETNDHGSFNSWGRDRYWHPDLQEMRRRVAAEPELALLDAVEPVVIRRNRWRTDNGFDVDLDDGSSNYVITENLLLRGGLKLREGFRRIVTNNVIINNGLHPHVSFPASGDVFARNIVMGPYQPIQVEQWTDDFDHNLFTSEHALADARALGSDAHSVAGDPEFLDAAAGDFRLAPSSPARALGFVDLPREFGVLSARLRRLARTPETPALLAGTGAESGAHHELAGATIKSLETLAEQSAVGTDASGALVFAVAPGCLAAEAGLQPWDVIRSVDVGGTVFVVHDAATLLTLHASHRWHGRLSLDVLRDHRTIRLELPYETS